MAREVDLGSIIGPQGPKGETGATGQQANRDQPDRRVKQAQQVNQPIRYGLRSQETQERQKHSISSP